MLPVICWKMKPCVPHRNLLRWKNRFLSIFIGVFLAVVLVLGGVLGIVVGVKNARAVVKYSNVTLDEETVNYLVAYYKMLYLNEPI